MPHIGTLLTTLAGDITARYRRMRGDDVFFVAGADENGLKIKEAAESLGRDPHEFVADISGRFESIFKTFHIEYDDFVRTTEARHFNTSQHFFQVLEERGHIYKGVYEGWYDVSTETFYKDADLVDGISPDGNPVRWVSEENYFFRLSAFQQPLLDHIEAHPEFIVPESRRNEVLSFIQQGLRDAAISRRNPGWGIPVPGNPEQVIYVWFDALINYVTATGWPEPGWDAIWPPIVQWVGKDILSRFHATLWPAMLMGIGLRLPEVVAAHAWIVLGSGEKLSKSKGNQVSPDDLSNGIAQRSGCDPEIAIDVVRYYLAATMPFENDTTFTHAEFDRRYNNDLANDLGNALNRTVAMTHRFCGGAIPTAEAEQEAIDAIELAKQSFESAMNGFRLERACESALGVIRFLNKYIDVRAPWALAKTNDPDLERVIVSMLLCIRASEGMIRPFMPIAADRIALQLGLSPMTDWRQIGRPDSLPAGVELGSPKPLFPRLDLKVPPAEPKVERKKEVMPNPPKPEPSSASEITIEDFAKIQLKVARIVEAEPLEGSDKLLKLQVLIGNQPRQIIAGIRKYYSAEDLIGRQVVVVANLKPAKLRGAESQGMLLAAVSEDGGAILLQPEIEAPEGATVR
jgi:methionyl-tRNA synthetase